MNAERERLIDVVELIDDNNVRRVITTAHSYEEALQVLQGIRDLDNIDLRDHDTHRAISWQIEESQSQRITRRAKECLRTKHSYSIRVRIGMIPTTFTLRKIGAHGYVLTRGSDLERAEIINEWAPQHEARAITALHDQICMYI